MRRGTLSYNEMLTIAKILGYKIEFKKVEEELFKIYQENTYCAHCGKKAIVSGSLKELKLSCDCDGAKSEITDKLAIKEEIKKLDDRFFEVQKAAINKAFGVYKIHYAENVKKRDEELKKFDEEIMNIVKGPDFPTGGIIFGKKGIAEAYKTGRGKILIRARFSIDVDTKGKETIVFTEIPYQVRTTDLVTRIGELARDKVIEGIERVNDGSAGDNVRIEVDLKKGVIAKAVLNQLFAKTALQSSYGIINLALEGIMIFGAFIGVLFVRTVQTNECFVDHRDSVITRRTQFELKKAKHEEHILEAKIVAVDCVDEVIKIIRGSRDEPEAKVRLMERFSFDEEQAQAIVDLRLGVLTNLRIDELKKQLAEIKALIAYLEDLLAHHEKILAKIKEETEKIVEKYGDERRTDIVADEIERLNIEDLIKREEVVVLISNLGYIKRIATSAYKIQGRGGKGSNSAKLVEDDFINQLFTASTHDYITFISSEGRAFWIKAHEIPEASRNSRGAHIKGLLQVSPNEEITTVVAMGEMKEDQYLFMVTANGVVKKVQTTEFANAKTRGIIGIKLDEGDKLVTTVLSSGNDEIVLITRQGKALRINEDEVRSMGRSTRGVCGIHLAQGDEVAAALQVRDGEQMLIMTEYGYGKRVNFEEFSQHGRGTGGQKVYDVKEKTGEIIGAITVAQNDEMMCITSQGKTLRVKASGVSEQSRTAGGVRILNIDPPDMVIGLDKVAEQDENENSENEEE